MNPPRFVEVATSGAVVTRYGRIASSRLISLRTRPNTSCVEIVPVLLTFVVIGNTAFIWVTGSGRLSSALRSARNFPASVVRSKPSHSFYGVRPNSLRNTLICSLDICAE